MILLQLACASPACPPEMAPVYAEAGGAPQFCMDRYEVVVKNPKGLAYTQGNNGFAAGSSTVSVPNMIPTSAVTFLEARALCEATPALQNGKEYGKKHLATVEEWRDAADGKAGPGGQRWPYGDRYAPALCNTPESRGKGILPTGAFPGCRTESGIYDQVGNLFEWVDPRLSVQVDATLRRFASLGYPLSVDNEGWLGTPPETNLSKLDSEATAIDRSSLRRDEAGKLWMRWQGSVPNPVGFLVLHDQELSEPDTMLPVRFITSPDQPEARLKLARELDGTPISEKTGGAWYQSGNWPNPKRNHSTDFRGTIGFRCAAPPSP